MAKVDNFKKVIYIDGNESVEESLSIAKLVEMGYKMEESEQMRESRKREAENMQKLRELEEILNS